MRPVRPTSCSNPSFLWPSVVLLVFGLCAYANSFRGVMLFDDVDGILKNPALRASSLMEALNGSPLDSTPYGRPLVLATLLLNHWCGGFEVAGYHVLNLLIHLGCGLVLFNLSFCLLNRSDAGSGSERRSMLVAWGVAMLWLLHPLNTSAVTYIVQRAESLMAFCYLGAMMCWTRGAILEERGRGWFLAAAVVCGLGMLAKESMVTAPLVIVGFDAVFFADGWREAWRRRWREYCALFAAWIPLLFCMLKWPRAHSTGTTESLGAWQYLLMQSEVVWHYLRLAVWPDELALDYTWRTPASIAEVWLPFSTLVIVVAALVRGVFRRRKAAFLGLFGFVVLAPTSSFVPVHTSVAAEHRMYLPLAAWIALSVAGFAGIVISKGRLFPVWLRIMACIFPILAGLGLGVRTWWRNADYRSALVIWSKVAGQQPDNHRALNNLASALIDAGRFEEARDALLKCIALKPDYAEALFNLGTLLGRAGQIAAAEDCLNRAALVAPSDADIRCNLANVYMARGDYASARRSLELALRVNPAHSQSRFNLAVVVLQQGEIEHAARLLDEVRARDPDYPKWELLDAEINAARVRIGNPKSRS